MVNGTVSTIFARPDLKRLLTLTFLFVGICGFPSMPRTYMYSVFSSNSSINFRFANYCLLFRVGQHLLTKKRLFRIGCNPKHCPGIVFLDLAYTLQGCRLEEYPQVSVLIWYQKIPSKHTHMSRLCSTIRYQITSHEIVVKRPFRHFYNFFMLGYSIAE